MNRQSNALRTVFRAGFVLYTLALLTATHWPGLTVHGPIDRTDLVIHVGVFFVWTCLLFGTQWIATGGCGCFKRQIAWVFVAGVCFAAFDELTQPIFNRIADPWDFGADAVGVAVACGMIGVWGKVKSSKAGAQQRSKEEVPGERLSHSK